MGNYSHAIELAQGLSLSPVALVNTGWRPLVYWEDDEGGRKLVKSGAVVRDKRTATFHAKSLCAEYQRHLDRTGQRREVEAEARQEVYRAADRLWTAYRHRLTAERDAMVGLLRDLVGPLSGGGFDRRVREILDRVGPEVPKPERPKN